MHTAYACPGACSCPGRITQLRSCQARAYLLKDLVKVSQCCRNLHKVSTRQHLHVGHKESAPSLPSACSAQTEWTDRSKTSTLTVALQARSKQTSRAVSMPCTVQQARGAALSSVSSPGRLLPPPARACRLDASAAPQTSVKLPGLPADHDSVKAEGVLRRLLPEAPAGQAR